jgi:xylose dehydrogenase (NAD/NADP)
MASVRWGLLGTARINRRLIPAMRAAERSVVTAVGSREPARAEAYAHEWQIPHAAGSYEALLAREDVDAVYIPLPNALHVDWTIAAAAAGKHVLCEKPLALDAADVDRIEAAAAANGVVVEEGFMYRHQPLTAAVTRLVAEGAVGAVRTISSGFTFAHARSADIRLEPALGGGALLDVGCYPVSYACLLVGRDPTDAAGMARLTTSGVDEEFSGLLRFPGDRTAAVYASFRAAFRTWLEITGSEGWMRVPNPFKPGPSETIVIERLGEQHTVAVAGSMLLFAREIEGFVRRVLDGAPAVTTLSDSRRICAALSMLRAAAGVTA